MSKFLSRAALLAASSLFAVAHWPRRRRRPPIPKPLKSSASSGSPRSPTALRDMNGWRAPRRIVMATQNPNGTGTQEIRATLAGVAPGVEMVFVADATDLIKEAANADAIIGGDDIVCDERVLAAAKRVRWVAVMSAGVEACLGKPALEKPGIDRDQHARGRGSRDGRAHHRADVRAVAFAAGVGRPAGDRRGLEPQLRGLTTAGADRQDDAGRGSGRHRPRSCEARSCARHEGDRHSQQLARRPRLRESRRPCPTNCRR